VELCWKENETTKELDFYSPAQAAGAHVLSYHLKFSPKEIGALLILSYFWPFLWNISYIYRPVNGEARRNFCQALAWPPA